MSEKMMLLTRQTAVVTATCFRRLPEYSCSLPTGKTLGKRWKCKKDYYDESRGWLLGEYQPDPDPNYVRICWRDLLVLEDDPR